MSYREQIYKSALKEIERIYIKSKYDPDTDLFRSFDIINSVNDNQIRNKEWLVEKLIEQVDMKTVKRICVLGSWYGLVSKILRTKIDADIIIDNVDSDPDTINIGANLLGDDKNTHFHHDDAGEYFFDRTDTFQLIINTSCEHMETEDISLITSMKPLDTLICFQSNNYKSVQSHINTHNSLEEFVESLGLYKVHYKETLKLKDYDRYMVIGQ